MTCSDVNDKLIDYLYGELDPDAARAVEEHARGCDACAAALKGFSATLVSTRSALQGPLDQRPPARVAARVRRQARRAGEIWPVALLRACVRWLERPLLLPVLGAAAIAVLGITLQLRSRPDLSERYALGPPPSASSPEVSTVRPAPEPAAQGERAPAAEGRAGNADRVANAPPPRLATREYAAAPPARSAPLAEHDSMKRSDEFSGLKSRRASSQKSGPSPAASARASARRAPAGAGREILAESEAPLVAEARPRASAAPMSDLRAELAVQEESATSAAAPPPSAAPDGMAEPSAPAPALRPLLQRADRAFRNKRWGTAAAAYRQLLRSYPAHRSAPVWERRLGIAETALEAR
jgi:hypothetical protein